MRMFKKLRSEKEDRKLYVLDTNVIMADPDCFYKFEDNILVIPDAVIEELDDHKRDYGDAGYNVRKACRILEKLSSQPPLKLVLSGTTDNLNYMIDETDGIISFTSNLNFDGFPRSWDQNKNDNRILAATKAIDGAILVSKDTNMRIKARTLRLNVQEYKNEAVEEDYLKYNGRCTAYTDEESFSGFEKGNAIPAEYLSKEESDQLHENEFVVLKCSTTDKKLIGIMKQGMLAPLKFKNAKPSGISPRNLGQMFAIEALMAPADEIPLVILKGSAGTAKTFLTLACGLEQTMEEQIYRKMTITRANYMMDNEIGALPGDEEDKVGPLLRGCMDNLEQLICGNMDDKSEKEIDDRLQYVFDKGWIKAEALGFLRGRSLTNQILYIDEAQNTTPSQMNAILTRIGTGSKVIIAGDLDQIDVPKLDRHNNGLAHAIKLMAGDPDCCIIGFTDEETTRSRLAAKVASKIAK